MQNEQRNECPIFYETGCQFNLVESAEEKKPEY